MAKDFFGEISSTLSKTVKNLSGSAEKVYNTQKINVKIAGLKRDIENAESDLGKILYERFKDGTELDEELKEICESIAAKEAEIAEQQATAAAIKGQKICPTCQKSVDLSVSFCPHCGAEVPTPEIEIPEEMADAAEEAAEDVKEAVQDAAEEAAEAVQDAVEEAAEAVKDAAEE